MSEIAVPTASREPFAKRGAESAYPRCCSSSRLLPASSACQKSCSKNPDTYIHIAVGRWIWESRSVPWIDVFSHTFAGADWIAKEWLSQLIFYGAFAAAGWRGVAALTAIVIAGSFALLFRWLRSPH